MGENELRQFAEFLLAPIRRELNEQKQESAKRFDRIESKLEGYCDTQHELVTRNAVIINDVQAIMRDRDERRAAYEAQAKEIADLRESRAKATGVAAVIAMLASGVISLIVAFFKGGGAR